MTENVARKKKTWRDTILEMEIPQLLAIFSIVLILMGSLMIVTYARLISFVECQGNYNQDTAETRDQRLTETNRESRKLFEWIATLPPLLRDDGDRKDLRDLEKTNEVLTELLAARQEKLQTQRENPYQQPEDFCN